MLNPAVVVVAGGRRGTSGARSAPLPALCFLAAVAAVGCGDAHNGAASGESWSFTLRDLAGGVLRACTLDGAQVHCVGG